MCVSSMATIFEDSERGENTLTETWGHSTFQMQIPALVKTISPPSGWEMQQLNPAEQNISIQVLGV